MMTKIERNIYHSVDPTKGEFFVFTLRKLNKRIWLPSLEAAREERLLYDQSKAKWTKLSIENVNDSKLYQDPCNGYWYSSMDAGNDILTSDLYKDRKDAKKIKQYLDKEGWTVAALNNQKRFGLECCNQFHNIYPVRDGFIIMDEDKNVLDRADTLQKAVELKERLSV